MILDALLKLRQVNCDPRLLPKPMCKVVDSVKLGHPLAAYEAVKKRDRSE